MLVLPEEAIDITFDCFRQGIYFLIEKGEVVYIGRSKNVMHRVMQHRHHYNQKMQGSSAEEASRPAIKFSRVAFIHEPSQNRRIALEAALIVTYQPKYNQKFLGASLEKFDARALLERIGLARQDE